MEPENKLPALKQDPHFRRLLLVIGYMLVVAGSAWAISLLWPIIGTIITILSPFLVAFVVAYLFNPIVSFVQRRLRMSRVAGVLFVNLMILMILAVFIGIIAPILVRQIRNAWNEGREIVTREVLPRVASEFNLTLETVEPTHGELLETVQAWKDEQLRRAEIDAQRLHLDELQREVAGWIAINAPADGETGDSAQDIQELQLLIDGWIERYPRTGDADALAGQLADLQTAVAEWANRRLAWLSGEPAELQFADFWRRIDAWLGQKGIYIDEWVENSLTGEQVTTAATQGFDIAGSVVGAIGRAIAFLITSVIFLVFVFLVSFYLLIDFAKLRGVAEIMIPDKFEDRFFDVLHKVDLAVGGFIRGQITVATTVGILATIGLYFLGLKQYAVLIGIITGIGNMIPYLGPIMGATPAVVYILVSDTYDNMQERLIRLGLLLGLFATIQFIEGFILQPKVVGKSAQLHPVIVILALALGAPFGIMGMIIALPIAAATRVLLKEFYWDRRELVWHQTTGKEKLDDIILEGKPVRKKKLNKQGLSASEEKQKAKGSLLGKRRNKKK